MTHAIEAAVGESERRLAELDDPALDTRLSIQLDGWFRGLAAALEELAVAVDDLAGRDRSVPAGPPREPQAVEQPDEPSDRPPADGDDDGEPRTEPQLIEEAQRSREETAALRDEAEAARRELER